jgi:hypothetical protein
LKPDVNREGQDWSFRTGFRKGLEQAHAVALEVFHAEQKSGHNIKAAAAKLIAREIKALPIPQRAPAPKKLTPHDVLLERLKVLIQDPVRALELLDEIEELRREKALDAATDEGGSLSADELRSFAHRNGSERPPWEGDLTQGSPGGAH